MCYWKAGFVIKLLLKYFIFLQPLLCETNEFTVHVITFATHLQPFACLFFLLLQEFWSYCFVFFANIKIVSRLPWQQYLCWSKERSLLKPIVLPSLTWLTSSSKDLFFRPIHIKLWQHLLGRYGHFFFPAVCINSKRLWLCGVCNYQIQQKRRKYLSLFLHQPLIFSVKFSVLSIWLLKCVLPGISESEFIYLIIIL
jgi:hypothetical protein